MMKTIAITGLGRTGTTYISRVFQEAGYDFGPDVKPSDIGKGGRPVGGGMEDPHFLRANVRMRNRPHQIQLKVAREFLAKHTPPQAVKDPRFIFTMRAWWCAGYRPDEIIISLRNWASLKDSYGSLNASPEGRLPVLNNFFCWVARNGIPLRMVLYPHIGREPDYADRALAGLMDNPSEFTQKVWDTSLNHFSK